MWDERPRAKRDKVDPGGPAVLWSAPSSGGSGAFGSEERRGHGEGNGSEGEARTRVASALAGLEFPEEDASRGATRNPPVLMQRYLDLRATGAGDGEAITRLAQDNGVPEPEVVRELLTEAKGMQADGQGGLERAIAHWLACSPTHEPRLARDRFALNRPASDEPRGFR